MANLHKIHGERVAAFNADLKRCALVIKPYTRDYRSKADKPYVLRSRLGEYVARYGTIERAEEAALAYDASALIAEGTP